MEQDQEEFKSCKWSVYNKELYQIELDIFCRPSTCNELWSKRLVVMLSVGMLSYMMLSAMILSAIMECHDTEF